jgi:hypothetical protein
MLFTSGYEGQWGSFEHDVSFCGSLIAPLTALYGDDAIPEIPPGGSMPDTTRLLAPLRRADVVRVTQHFTPPSHYGIDYSCFEGTPIFASCDGIAYRGSQPSGFGLYVRVEDGGGLYVYAAHLRAWAVADGAVVQAGDVIGYSGNTGNSTGPHVHYEVRRGSRLQACAVDPEPLIVWETPAIDVGAEIAKAMQAYVIPLVDFAALERKARELGLVGVSTEQTVTVAGAEYIAQVYRSPVLRDAQYTLWCRPGEWDKINVTETEN